MTEPPITPNSGLDNRMSGFHELGDEFAGEEANHEWEAAWAAYSSGAQTDTGKERLALSTVLNLPIGHVEIRGDDPGVEFCLLTNANVMSSAGDIVEFPTFARPSGGMGHPSGLDGFSDSKPAALVVECRSLPSGTIGYSILDPRGNEVDAGELGDSESAAELLDRVVEVSTRIDELNSYLTAGCVVLNGQGVLVFSADSGSRDRTLEALLSAGAAYLSDSVVAFNPSTRVLAGVPRPRFGVGANRAIMAARADVVVIVVSRSWQSDGLEGDLPDPIRLTYELRQFIVAESFKGPLSLVSLAELVGASRVVEVSENTDLSSVEKLTALLAAGAAGRSEGSVVSWFESRDAPELSAQIYAGEAWLSVDDAGEVRFLQAGDADDLAGDRQRVSQRKLVPAALGLPNCPPVGELGEIWRATGGVDLSEQLPSAIVAEFVAAGFGAASDGNSVADRVERAERLSREALGAFVQAVDATAGGSAPVVVIGDLLDFADGHLPGRFVDLEKVQFLVPPSAMTEFVEQLEAAGFSREPVTVSNRSLDEGFGTVLVPPNSGEVGVEISSTLATGPFGELVDPEEFHSMAVPVRIGGRWTKGLHPAHRFIHACLRFDRSEVTDLRIARSVVLNAPRTEAATRLMLDSAHRLGTARTVLGVISRVDDMLPGVPERLATTSTESQRKGRWGRKRSRR